MVAPTHGSHGMNHHLVEGGIDLRDASGGSSSSTTGYEDPFVGVRQRGKGGKSGLTFTLAPKGMKLHLREESNNVVATERSRVHSHHRVGSSVWGLRAAVLECWRGRPYTRSSGYGAPSRGGNKQHRGVPES